jgi:HD-GYP domain-containing protein (c-di-GMP phosphodiesterase class II)
MMRRIMIKEARPGMKLLRRAEGGPGGAAAGTTLSVADIIRLHEAGVYDLWVGDADGVPLDGLLAAGMSKPQQRLAEALAKAWQGLMGQATAAGQALARRSAVTAADVLQGVVRVAGAVPAFAAVADADDDLGHAADVCVLATLLGLQLDGYVMDQRRRLTGRSARDVLNLAVGAALHDVAATDLPPRLREAHADPAADGDGGWFEHTARGYALVRAHVDPSAATVVLHHHQRFDGSGRARVDGRDLRQAGPAIHVFARIAAAADLLWHHQHPPGAGVPHPAVRALFAVQQAPARGWLDPVVLDALVGLVAPFAPGMVVTLCDRRQAVVTRAVPAAPCFPEVQVLRTPGVEGGGETIDLAACPVHVAAVDGADVAPFLYGPRPAPVSAAA